jgi:hypothetical protein
MSTRGVCPTVVAQALRGSRPRPTRNTIDRASSRAKVVLFKVVPRASNRARPHVIGIAVRERQQRTVLVTFPLAVTLYISEG